MQSTTWPWRAGVSSCRQSNSRQSKRTLRNGKTISADCFRLVFQVLMSSHSEERARTKGGLAQSAQSAMHLSALTKCHALVRTHLSALVRNSLVRIDLYACEHSWAKRGEESARFTFEGRRLTKITYGFLLGVTCSESWPGQWSQPTCTFAGRVGRGNLRDQRDKLAGGGDRRCDCG